MEQEKKLAEYRARKKREQQMQQYKDNIKNLFTWKTNEPPVVPPENEVSNRKKKSELRLIFRVSDDAQRFTSD